MCERKCGAGEEKIKQMLNEHHDNNNRVQYCNNKLCLLYFFHGTPVGAITAKKDQCDIRSINSSLV